MTGGSFLMDPAKGEGGNAMPLINLRRSGPSSDSLLPLISGTGEGEIDDGISIGGSWRDAA